MGITYMLPGTNDLPHGSVLQICLTDTDSLPHGHRKSFIQDGSTYIYCQCVIPIEFSNWDLEEQGVSQVLSCTEITVHISDPL